MSDDYIIPDELAEFPRWIVWDRVTKSDGTVAKIPFNPRTLDPASASNPDTWTSFDEAWEQFGSYAGLGFVFNGDGIMGIDLDGCLNEASQTVPWASEILDRFSTTYAEVSPSGKGIKIFARGKLAGPIKKSFADHTGVEAYSKGRYFALTGKMCGTVENVTDCQSAVDWLVLKYGARTLESQGYTRIKPIYTGPLRTLDDMLGQWCVKAGHRIPFSNGDGYKRHVTCPFNPVHSNTDAYVYERNSGAMGFHCSHNSCAKNKWSEFRLAVGGAR